MRLPKLPVLAVSAIVIVTTASGCAAEVPEEAASASIESALGGCDVASALASGSRRVAVRAWVTTGVCAAGALATTAGTGEVVCLAPLVGAALSSIVALFARGVAYLSCSAASGVGSRELSLADEDAPRGGGGRTCDDDEHRRLAAEKDAACNNLPGRCDPATSYPSLSAECLALGYRRGEYEKCRDARQRVIDECFGGTPSDAAHARELRDMTRLAEECERIERETCTGF